MRTFTMAILTLALFLVPSIQIGSAEGPETPLMRTVKPQSAKAGGVVIVSGEALDKSRVAEVYLTDNTNDFKMEILEQSSESIRFRIPAATPSGRFCLMVLLAKEPKFIEQPVYLVVQ